MRSYQNFIGGELTSAASSQTFANFNPADTREAVAQYPQGGRADALAAIAAAVAAAPGWAAQTSVARGRILSKASQLIEARKPELAELLTREEGKTLAEATGEVQRTADIFRCFGGLSYVLGGQTIPHDLPSQLLYTRREPLGVVALITPWNFPIAIPAWKMAPALVSGNAVIIKPASQAPAMTCELAKILAEAGLPKGVLNVVIGSGKEGLPLILGPWESSAPPAAASVTSDGQPVVRPATPGGARSTLDSIPANPSALDPGIAMPALPPVGLSLPQQMK